MSIQDLRVAHISFSYANGGAGIAAARIHEALLDAGVKSRFFCVTKALDGREITILPQNKILSFIFKYATKISRHIFSPFFHRAISFNVVPSGMPRCIRAFKPDLIHIHWISAETLSWRELSALKYPTIISLHDFWFLTALEPYPKYDTRFQKGYTKTNSTIYERFLDRKKTKFLSDRKILFTAPSQWAIDVASSAKNAKHHCFKVVSNVFNTNEFYFDASMRENIGEKLFAIFGAQYGTSNSIKGFDDLRKALEFLPSEIKENLTILIFGESASPRIESGVRIEFLGEIKGANNLRNVYHKANFFLFPSRFETQGQTKVEAMLCGLPVVAFNRSACAEGLTHKGNGYIAKKDDCEDFAKGICWCIENLKNGSLSHSKISEKAHEIYGVNTVLNGYLSAYRSWITPPPNRLRKPEFARFSARWQTLQEAA